MLLNATNVLKYEVKKVRVMLEKAHLLGMDKFRCTRTFFIIVMDDFLLLAPEVLNYEPISLATDIWSVGVLAYVLLSGYSPFAGDTKQETFCNITQCSLSFPQDLFSNISEYGKDFIMIALMPEPK